MWIDLRQTKTKMAHSTHIIEYISPSFHHIFVICDFLR